MKILFFDCETTGLPKNFKSTYKNIDNWPRIVQIAWIITDSEGTLVSEKNFIVKPDNFSIPKKASSIHGITNEIANFEGLNINYVLNNFIKDLLNSDFIVAHNIEFDRKVVNSELFRNGFKNIIEENGCICTMKSSIDYCKITGEYGYKYPKLEELFFKIFQQKINNIHNAFEDVKATKKCFFYLKEQNIITLVQENDFLRIHYIGYHSGGMQVFTDNNKRGVVTKNQKIIIPALYDSIYFDEFSNEIYLTRKETEIIMYYHYGAINEFPVLYMSQYQFYLNNTKTELAHYDETDKFILLFEDKKGNHDFFPQNQGIYDVIQKKMLFNIEYDRILLVFNSGNSYSIVLKGDIIFTYKNNTLIKKFRNSDIAYDFIGILKEENGEYIFDYWFYNENENIIFSQNHELFIGFHNSAYHWGVFDIFGNILISPNESSGLTPEQSQNKVVNHIIDLAK